MDTTYTKEASKVMTSLIKSISNLLDIPYDDFLNKFGEYIYFDGDNVEGLKTAFKPNRGLSPKYFGLIEKALKRILEENQPQQQEGDTVDRTMIICTLIEATHILEHWHQKLECVVKAADNFYLPTNFFSNDFMQDVSPSYSFCLNRCYKEISSLSKNDIWFLCIYNRLDMADEIERMLSEYQDVPSSDIPAKLTRPEVLSIQKLKVFFDDHSGGINTDPVKNWEHFLNKFKQESQYRLCLIKSTQYTKMLTCLFVQLTYPSNGERETTFTGKDFDALLRFRLLLSEKTQNEFINDAKEKWECRKNKVPQNLF